SGFDREIGQIVYYSTCRSRIEASESPRPGPAFKLSRTKLLQLYPKSGRKSRSCPIRFRPRPVTLGIPNWQANGLFFGGEMRGFAEHSSIVHDSVTFCPYDSAEHQILLTGSQFVSILRLTRTRC